LRKLLLQNPKELNVPGEDNMTNEDGEFKLTPVVILEQIVAASPIPTDWIKRDVWLLECGVALKKILMAVESEYKIATETILDTGMVDDKYELVPITKQVREVNKALLRQMDPTTYAACAYVDADTCFRLLGKRYLRQLLIDKIGEDEVVKLDSVNIESLIGDDDEEEDIAYIETFEVPNGYVLQRKAVN